MAFQMTVQKLSKNPKYPSTRAHALQLHMMT
ncbi:uncharacterized protein G2W53_018624 [Senna tora]|uniref:Uncharacterized protein n=1 Tax=Senna tora TaxID=362788 RepID=A0A834TS63_9FABA|nr:uncharacterized protein G2W53_018624 [Senna tora]